MGLYAYGARVLAPSAKSMTAKRVRVIQAAFQTFTLDTLITRRYGKRILRNNGVQKNLGANKHKSEVRSH